MSLTVEKCLQAWTNSLRQMNVKADVVFFGDSLIYYGNFSSVFPDKVVCNLGLRGDTIQGLINRIEQIELLCPAAIYLMIGINDVAISDLNQFRINYKELLQQLKVRVPNSELIVYNMLPVNNYQFLISCDNTQISLYNIEIEKAAKQLKIQFVDLFSIYQKDGFLPSEVTTDGIHLKSEGYKKWYELIKRKN